MKHDIFFNVKTPLGITIRTTKEYWNYLVETKHRVMEGKEEIVKDTLSQPNEIRRSKVDEDVYLYYKKRDNKLYCAVARHGENEGFLITAYITDKIKEGKLVWIK